MNALHPSDHQKLNKLTTAAAKVRFCLQLLRREELLPADSLFVNGKNNDLALAEEKKGNEYLGKKNYLKALEHYNRSLCFSPTGLENLSIVYANRSAIYFNTGHYEACLENIELAEEHGYPDKLKPKLMKRKENCSAMINNNRDKKTIDNNLNFEENSKVFCAFDGIKVAKNEKYGRHIVATRDFNPGDVLVIDKPFCPTLNKDVVYSYCLYCMESNLMNLRPCPESTTAMFCSKDCYNESMEQFFKYEGPIQACVYNNFVKNFSPALFVIRFALKAFCMFESPEQLKNFLDEVPVGQLSAFDIDYLNASQKEILRLVYALKSNTPFNDSPRSVRFIQYSAIAYHILMTKTVLKTIVRTKKYKRFLMEFLVDICRIVANNANTIHGSIADKESSKKGTAVYPISSLFNHSCESNVWEGSENYAVKVAIRPIKSGEQLFVRYVHDCLNKTQDERQKELSPYGFKCQCIACENSYFPIIIDDTTELPAEIVFILNKVSSLTKEKWKNLEQVRLTLKTINQWIKIFHTDLEDLKYQFLINAQSALLNILNRKPHLSFLLE